MFPSSLVVLTSDKKFSNLLKTIDSLGGGGV